MTTTANEARRAAARMNDDLAATLTLEAARAVEANAADYREGGKYGADAEMVRMYVMDAADLRVIAERIDHGNHAGAMEKAASMDTAARDEVPAAVWVYIGGELNG